MGMAFWSTVYCLFCASHIITKCVNSWSILFLYYVLMIICYTDHSEYIIWTVYLVLCFTYGNQRVARCTRLSQGHNTQLHKIICSCTDFIRYTGMNWLVSMQLHILVIEIRATVSPIVQLRTPTFRQEKAIQNDVMTTTYHQWGHDVDIRSYTLVMCMLCLTILSATVANVMQSVMATWPTVARQKNTFSNYSSYVPITCIYLIVLILLVCTKSILKLPSMLAAWLFWTFHIKSNNMKELIILSHSWSPFLTLTCLYEKNELLWVSVQPSGVFSWEKNYLQITNANHMTMTTSAQF